MAIARVSVRPSGGIVGSTRAVVQVPQGSREAWTTRSSICARSARPGRPAGTRWSERRRGPDSMSAFASAFVRWRSLAAPSTQARAQGTRPARTSSACPSHVALGAASCARSLQSRKTSQVSVLAHFRPRRCSAPRRLARPRPGHPGRRAGRATESPAADASATTARIATARTSADGSDRQVVSHLDGAAPAELRQRVERPAIALRRRVSLPPGPPGGTGTARIAEPRRGDRRRWLGRKPGFGCDSGRSAATAVSDRFTAVKAAQMPPHGRDAPVQGRRGKRAGRLRLQRHKADPAGRLTIGGAGLAKGVHARTAPPRALPQTFGS